MANYSNPSEMSDDELFEAIDTLNKRLVWVNQNGNPFLLEQLQQLKSLCEQEHRLRLMQAKGEQIKQSSPVVVESDPELAREHRRAEEEQAEASKPKRKKELTRRPMLRRTVKPTDDD